jgi:hypothetical protein
MPMTDAADYFTRYGARSPTVSKLPPIETRPVDPERVARANEIRKRLKTSWPNEFGDGALCAFTQHFSGDRETGGYPRGFNKWPLERRNAWFAGYGYGRVQRLSGGAL